MKKFATWLEEHPIEEGWFNWGSGSNPRPPVTGGGYKPNEYEPVNPEPPKKWGRMYTPGQKGVNDSATQQQMDQAQQAQQPQQQMTQAPQWLKSNSSQEFAKKVLGNLKSLVKDGGRAAEAYGAGNLMASPLAKRMQSAWGSPTMNNSQDILARIQQAYDQGIEDMANAGWNRGLHQRGSKARQFH